MNSLKRIFSILVCICIFGFIYVPVLADDDLHFEDGFDTRDYSFWFETDGMEFVSKDDLINDYPVAYTQYTHARLERGKTMTIHVSWIDSLRANSIEVGYKKKDEELIEKYIAGDYWREFAIVSSNTAPKYSISFDSPWSTLINQSDEEITVQVTAPKDPSVNYIEIEMSAATPGFVTCYILCIDLYGDVDEGIVQTENTEANIDPGEDPGTVIDDQIVNGLDKETLEKVAVSVAGATVAGAIAMGGIDSNKDNTAEDNKKHKTYKMKVYKNFGNGIHKGAKPVTVWARIVEIEDGVETNSPKLSEKITVSGSGMIVQPAGVHNTYMGASCSIPKDSTAQKATLTFTFTGEGGVFHNNITFRVLDDSRIVFPRLTDDGKNWDMNADISRVNMIAGLGGKDRLRFVISNTDVEPKEIRFKNNDGFVITKEKDAQLAFTYYACIENKTGSIEKVNGVFAAFEDKKIIVEAVFDDESVIDSYFTVRLYPDGLSVTADKRYMLKDSLMVNTIQKEEVTPGYSPFEPTVFSVSLAYMNSKGEATIIENSGFKYHPLNDDEKYGCLFKENFEFDIQILSSNAFFYPHMTIPSLKDPYEAVLPIEIEKEGTTYHADLPMTFIGKTPDPAVKYVDREKEIKLLRKDIEIFGLVGDPQLLGLIRAANRGDFSGGEIQNIRRRMLEAATAFDQAESDAQMKMANLFSDYVVVAGALQTGGDYALRFVMNNYFPGYGDVAGCIINPFKNMLCSYLGQQAEKLSWLNAAPEYSDGKTPAVDFVEVVLKCTEDAMASAIGFMIMCDTYRMNPTQLARYAKAMDDFKNAAGYIVATYLITSYVEHYYGYNGKGKKGEKGDVYRSVKAAFLDLTYEGLKSWLFKYIQKYCRQLFEKIGQFCGNVYKEVCQKKIAAAAVQAGEKVFNDTIREQVKLAGNSSLSTDAFLSAKLLKETAIKITTLQQNLDVDLKVIDIMNGFADSADGVNLIIGQFLNYGMGGNGEDGTDSYGGDTKDVLYGALTKWLGVKIKNLYEHDLYEGGGIFNKKDVTVRVENGQIILGVLGYIAEINILENIFALSALLYDGLFSWMDTLWKAGKTNFDTESIPDERFRTMSSIMEVWNQLEKQKQEFGKFEWQYTKYKKKTESGYETIL